MQSNVAQQGRDCQFRVQWPRRLMEAKSAYPAVMNAIGPENELVVRCECGFETRGTADQIVPALQKHAGESHNMKVTREQVLARAEPV
jgi:predicted small metal-binding protein